MNKSPPVPGTGSDLFEVQQLVPGTGVDLSMR